jgi:23S rRNA (cytosine1962-C5)-methyltransferase
MKNASPLPTLLLKDGREKSLRHGHPWIFSGAVGRLAGNPAPGETVRVCSASGQFLAHAAFSPASQIRARVWSFEEGDRVDEAFLRARIRAALASRAGLAQRGDACRLIHAESDGLPGLVADRYGQVLVVQFLSAGAEYWRDTLVEALAAESGCTTLYERSDAEVRQLEGLPQRTGVLRGSLPGDLVISEDGIRYGVNVVSGQKTGFYLDQRDNRRLVAGLARDRAVLNCFCYTGGFTLGALAGGARSVLSLDSSAEALDQARRNLSLNALPEARAEWRAADVFQELRRLRDQNRKFGLIILDPPKFAPTAQHAAKAARAYKDINLLAMKLLEPAGLLATFSCSGGMERDLFQKVIAGAAADARIDMRLLQRLAGAEDHPVLLRFPEGEYLKGLLLQRLP